MNPEREKRKRKAAQKFEPINNDELILLQQALENSKKETKRVNMALEVPEAPTFYPAEDEWKNPLEYISKIRPVAQEYGICKIVPPAVWNPPSMLDYSCPKEFPTKLQNIATLQEGKGFDDGRRFTLVYRTFTVKEKNNFKLIILMILGWL